MQFIQFVATRPDTGAALPFAHVTVYATGTTNVAAIYDVNGNAITGAALADANGTVGFAAANGAYDLSIASGDGSYALPLVRDVQLYDLTQLDAKVASVVTAAAATVAVSNDLALGPASLIRQAPGAAMTAVAQAGIASSQAQVAILAGQQAGAAAASVNGAVAEINMLAGISATYASYSAANGAVGSIADQALVLVAVDETRGNLRALYRKSNGALGFVLTLPGGGSRKIWHDPKNGSDTTGNGTGLQPFQTLGMCGTVASAGDTVATVPGGVRITEVFNSSTGPLPPDVNYEGNGATFDATDPLTPQFTASGAGYTFPAPITWGSATSAKSGATQFITELFVQTSPTGVAQMKEVRFGEGASYSFQLPDRATCIAYALANAGYYFVDCADGSNYQSGWTNQTATIYAQAAPDGTPINAATLRWATRIAPEFGARCKASDFTAFGGIGHNGVTGYGGRFDRVRVMYPGLHGMIIPGCDSDRLWLFNANPSAPIATGFHHFNSAALFAKRSRHDNALIVNWDSAAAAAIGCHPGSGTADVMGYIEFNDLRGFNVANVGGGCGNITNGITLNRPMLFNVGTIGGSDCDLTLNNAKITGDSRGGGANYLFQAPTTTGKRLNINGGTASHNFGLIYCNGASLGRIGFLGGFKALIAGAPFTGGGWLRYDNGSQTTIAMDQTSLQCYAGADEACLSSIAASGSVPLTITRSCLSGIADPSATAGVSVDAYTTLGGDIGLSLGTVYDVPVEIAPDSAVHDIGDVAVAAFSATDGQNLRTTFLLSSSGLRQIGSQGTGALLTAPYGFATPTGVVWRGGGIAGGNRQAFCFGDGGTLYVSGGYADLSNGMTKVVTGTTADIIGRLTYDQDAIVFLLGRDGSMLKWDTSSGGNNTITKLSFNAGYPLTGGYRDGANLIVWGSLPDGSKGGAYYSKDTGSTFTAVANVGAIRCGCYTGAGYVLFADGGNLYSGATVDAAFANRQLPTFYNTVDIVACAGDRSRQQVVFIGAPTGLQYRPARWQAFGYLTVSDPNPNNWTLTQLEAPFKAMGGVWYNMGGYFQQQQDPQVIVSSKTARWASSETFANWRRMTTLNTTKTVRNPVDHYQLDASLLS